MDRFIILSLLFIAAFMLSLGSLQLIGRWRQRALQDIDQPKKMIVKPILVRPIRLLRDRRLSESRRVHDVLSELPGTWPLQRLITQSGAQFMTDRILLIMAMLLLTGVFLGLLMSLSVIVTAALGLTLGLSPIPVLVALKKRRLERINEQLPDLLDSLARSLQAGNSFSTSLANVSREAPEPISSEFRQISEEINFGSSLKDSLQSLSKRINSTDINYFTLAVLTHTQTGGNLSELLLSLASLIRDRQRLRKIGRVLSAEGRLSGWILGALPFVTGALIFAINPTFISVLWKNPSGVLLMQITAVMMVIGVIWMVRIVNFRI
jgi:tight adherence protein B